MKLNQFTFKPVLDKKLGDTVNSKSQISIVNDMILHHSKSSELFTENNNETVFKSSIYAKPEHSKSFAAFYKGSEAVFVGEQNLIDPELVYGKDASPLIDTDGTPLRTKLHDSDKSVTLNLDLNKEILNSKQLHLVKSKTAERQ